MQFNTTPTEKPMQAIDMQIDLSGKEVIALYALALLGMETMSCSIDNMIKAMAQVADFDIDPLDAEAAVKKLKAGISLSFATLDEEKAS